ncbi:MAG: cytidylate kinase-like family protein [Acidobacteria bacterium]|jgi:cytidylate kinase|nr:cytidylate kinase-like family protein [Acidobacteriota bacterium]
MPIIFVSGLPFGGGERLARELAKKLGYDFVSREEIVAKANEAGIPVGKLEVAMIKKPAVQERMARLRERYLAVATAAICEKASEGKTVYYGRAGHLLLPGVSHVLRIKVVPEENQRLQAVMQRLKLGQEKAEKFLKDIDEDIRAWVRFVHGVDMDDARNYDFVINMEKISVENTATALCAFAQLPDFQPTPASLAAMEERLLRARARIRLALDERLHDAELTVRSNDGIVTVTYMPRQAKVAPLIPEVLKDLPGCRGVRCTMASTNILWIQERFQPDSQAFKQVNELARRWGAAVELLRYTPGQADGAAAVVSVPSAPVMRRATGGIEDDVADKAVGEKDLDFQSALEALVGQERSGGGQAVSGSREQLLAAISPTVPYSLVVVGDLFMDKGESARKRMTREMTSFLAGQVKAPVITTDELGVKLRFGPREMSKLLGYAALVAICYIFVFTHQEAILNILGGAFHKDHPWGAVGLVAVMAPLVAALYGTVASLVLRLLKLE